jgi:hypothetical protein
MSSPDRNNSDFGGTNRENRCPKFALVFADSFGSRLVSCYGINFVSVGIIPQGLSLSEIDSVLGLVGLALCGIKFELHSVKKSRGTRVEIKSFLLRASQQSKTERRT